MGIKQWQALFNQVNVVESIKKNSRSKQFRGEFVSF